MSNLMKFDDFLNHAIITSRIRIARNMVESPFPIVLSKKKGELYRRSLVDRLTRKTELGIFKYFDLNKIAYNDTKVLVEKNLAGATILQNRDIKGILISKDERTSVLINDEDHVRIQTIREGLDLEGAWKIVSGIDDQIDNVMNYAFDENLGYLTSCTTNLGTGMRASIMVHLPALTLTGYMDRIYQAANQIGMAVRGTFGEGTDIYGSVYQISNQVTLGRKESEIIGTLMEVTKEIVRKEMAACETILANHKVHIEDKVYRALGIIKNARIIDLQESINLLSDIRLGYSLGIIGTEEAVDFEKILINIQEGSLQNEAGKLVTNSDFLRADYLRKLW